MAGEIHDVEGYVACSACGRFVVTEVAARTGGLCSDDWIEQGRPELRRLEVIGRGKHITVGAGRRKSRSKKETPQRRARRREAGKAKEAARRRVAAMFPEIYAIVLAEERGARGLEPWTIDAALTPSGDPELERRFAELDRLTEGVA